jgi:uncharacterized protein (DUF1919 family)
MYLVSVIFSLYCLSKQIFIHSKSREDKNSKLLQPIKNHPLQQKVQCAERSDENYYSNVLCVWQFCDVLTKVASGERSTDSSALFAGVT